MLVQKQNRDEEHGVPPELAEPVDPVRRERLLDEAEAEIEAGHGVPGEKVSVWLRELAAGRPAKAPCNP